MTDYLDTAIGAAQKAGVLLRENFGHAALGNDGLPKRPLVIKPIRGNGVIGLAKDVQWPTLRKIERLATVAGPARHKDRRVFGGVAHDAWPLCRDVFDVYCREPVRIA